MHKYCISDLSQQYFPVHECLFLLFTFPLTYNVQVPLKISMFVLVWRKVNIVYVFFYKIINIDNNFDLQSRYIEILEKKIFTL